MSLLVTVNCTQQTSWWLTLCESFLVKQHPRIRHVSRIAQHQCWVSPKEMISTKPQLLKEGGENWQFCPQGTFGNAERHFKLSWTGQGGGVGKGHDCVWFVNAKGAAKHCAGHKTTQFSRAKPQSCPGWGSKWAVHFTEEGTDAWRNQVTYPTPHLRVSV